MKHIVLMLALCAISLLTACRATGNKDYHITQASPGIAGQQGIYGLPAQYGGIIINDFSTSYQDAGKSLSDMLNPKASVAAPGARAELNDPLTQPMKQEPSEKGTNSSSMPIDEIEIGPSNTVSTSSKTPSKVSSDE